jgi:benzylsuccinate CoA-transferase BbsE subunit
MGAEVVKLEPPEGSPTRRVGPFANGEAGPDASLTFWFYNSNKESVVADVARRRGARCLTGCSPTRTSSSPPCSRPRCGRQDSDLAALSAANAKLIVLSVTPFGLTGPWADYKSSDLVALAAGGPLNSCGYDDHTIPPIRPGGNQAYHSAASFAQIGVMLALLERQKTGLGSCWTSPCTRPAR